MTAPAELIIDVVLDPEFELQSASTAVDVTPVEPVLSVITVDGPPGPPGPPGDNSPVFNESLTGVKDGVNTVFTTANAYQAASTRVYRNGLREYLNVGYSESGAGQITFDEPPLTTDDITTDYLIT